jgi:hypothetical protein
MANGDILVWRDTSSINRLLRAHPGGVMDMALSGGDQLVSVLLET